MLQPVSFDHHLTLDVDRQRAEPLGVPSPFWSLLPHATTPHVAPTTMALAPETGAAIAVMGARRKTEGSL